MPPLVAIGDSFTQGFKSLAVSETHLSFPALIARALGVEFSSPDFSHAGGLPLNMETLLRKSGKRVGLLSILSLFTGIGRLGRWNKENLRYWNSPKALRDNVSHQPPLHHNLAIWGYCV